MESYDWTVEKLSEYIQGLNNKYEDLRVRYRKAKMASEAYDVKRQSQIKVSRRQTGFLVRTI